MIIKAGVAGPKPPRQTYEGRKKRDYDSYKEDIRSAHLNIFKFLVELFFWFWF